jgi:hypothetical protein
MNRSKVFQGVFLSLLSMMGILILFFLVLPQVSAATGCFNDTNGHIFETYICWMDDNGITSGCGGGNFCPNDSVTRGQMSVFIKRVYDLAEANDDDTLGDLSCSTDEIAKWNGSAWECQEDVDTDTDTDTLASLSCSTDEIAKWNGSAWVCESLSNYYTKSEVDSLLADLDSRVAALETKLASVSVSGDDLYFTGVNVHVRSGSGSTDGTINGLGNLIIGYNEDAGDDATRTGSHNLVVGSEHSWTSFGGFVVGFENFINGPYSSVSGGWFNTASGNWSSVSGGRYNTASGYYSSVSGGRDNTAKGNYSSVSGGRLNTASGILSSVSGGWGNTANGYWSSVSGGDQNTASGYYSSVSGGLYNTASDDYSSVSGGAGNTASGHYSSVSGGRYNTASGNYSSVSGGYQRSVSGIDDWRAGTLFETQ